MSVKYKISQIPGKGEGLIATHRIKAGEVIIKESPLLATTVIRAVSLESVIAGASSEFKNLCLSLSQDKKEEFRTLHSARALKPGEDGFELDVFKTNALPQGDTPSAYSVFTKICKINHSCVPNANYWWQENEKKGAIYCIKDIEEGEEITIFYAGSPYLFETRENRKDFLKAKWGFTCNCGACSLTGELLQKSDRSRKLLSSLIESGPTFIETDPARAIELIKIADKLYDSEGLFAVRGRLYYDAYQVCAAWADYKHAKIWAQRALDAFEKEQGPTSEGSRKARHFVAKPNDHPSSGMLGERKLSS